ncbi:MAG: hypothetical protein ACJ8AT_33440 [Hyalangium sp.]|uniref:hypothetical protein n=1 Tax=Hyalangium sp. TaxID=2028555 RepID=UPI00389AB4B5
MNPILPALGLCALLLTLPVQAAAPDPLVQGTEDHEAQILGWSADGKRFAMRLYLHPPFTSRAAPNPPPYCEGYVNHENHYFHGGLVWLAYERGHLLDSFVILAPDTCTPIPEAEQRLAAAKKKLAELGISLEATGQELVPPVNTNTLAVDQGPHAPYTLEYEEHTTAQAPNSKSGNKRGTLEQSVYMQQGKARQKLLGRKVPYEYSAAMMGYLRTGLDRVWLSPSGSTMVVLGYERVGNMSGGRKSLRMLGMLGWSGNALKPL